MKKLFGLLVTFAMIQPFAAQNFDEDFKNAFLKSIAGLESLKNGKTDSGWKSQILFPEFQQTEIVFLNNAGLHALVLSNPVADAATGDEMLARWKNRIASLLPSNDYIESKTYAAEYAGYMKTVFDFNSGKFAEKQKRPSVEMGTVQRGDQFVIQLMLIEPHFKNQYTPRY